ncbi:MAG: penicillin-binding protein 1B [Gammaproteobacteria bacterium]
MVKKASKKKRTVSRKKTTSKTTKKAISKTKSNNKNTKRNSRKKKAISRKRRLSSIFSLRSTIYLSVISLIMLSSWLLWLDHTIQQQFEGQRWALPARVFARPLELFSGKKINLVDVQTELKILGYRRVLSAKNPGEFSANKRVINLHTRGFVFLDGKESAQKASLQFRGERLTKITQMGSKKVIPIVRIEPVEIAKIFPTHREDRVILKYEDIPPFLIQALLATEDRRFYQHHGVDPKGIARAFWINLKAMKTKQGASTLTQQLIKNFYLTHERTFKRKFNELVMALLLELRYEKNEILTAYMNEVFLGQDNNRAIHGFGLAAEYYFAAPLNELRPEQLAMLVGLVKGPSYYEPRRHPQRAKTRRDIVLKSMAVEKKISESQKQKYSTKSLGVKPKRSLSRSRYPAFTDLVRKQLIKNYDQNDLRTTGLKIFTTLDPILQEKAENILKNKILNLEQQKQLPKGQLQGAIVLTDIKSGETLAIVGGREPRNADFNRAINSTRHIGSLIKPVVYLEALEQGRTLATIVKDEPITWEIKDQKSWQPENYDKKFHGEVPLINALVNSYNAATVWLGRELGIASVVDRIKSLGLGRSISGYPSILLGAVTLSPLEISRVYQTIANDGFSIPPRAIRAVLTKENKPLQRNELEIDRIIDSEDAYLLKYAMTEVVRIGTAKAASSTLSNLPLAGKTGTTGDLRDSWFAGFDQNTLSVIWLGRDDNKSSGLTGASGALRVWINLMKAIPTIPVNLTPPENIEWYWINQQSGKISEKECAGTIPLPFKSGSISGEVESCEQKGGFFGL